MHTGIYVTNPLRLYSRDVRAAHVVVMVPVAQQVTLVIAHRGNVIATAFIAVDAVLLENLLQQHVTIDVYIYNPQSKIQFNPNTRTTINRLDTKCNLRVCLPCGVVGVIISLVSGVIGFECEPSNGSLLLAAAAAAAMADGSAAPLPCGDFERRFCRVVRPPVSTSRSSR